jgi:hypothetical protein
MSQPLHDHNKEGVERGGSDVTYSPTHKLNNSKQNTTRRGLKMYEGRSDNRNGHYEEYYGPGY